MTNDRDSIRDSRQVRTGEVTQDVTDEVRVPLAEEELVAQKSVQEQGRVRLHKDVVEEQESLTVPVQHEQVQVERVAVGDNVSAGDLKDAFVEGDIEVPVMGEEVVTSKRAHVAEEVRVHKDVVTEQEQVSGTVRREQVVLDDDTTRR